MTGWWECRERKLIYPSRDVKWCSLMMGNFLQSFFFSHICISIHMYILMYTIYTILIVSTGELRTCQIGTCTHFLLKSSSIKTGGHFICCPLRTKKIIQSVQANGVSHAINQLIHKVYSCKNYYNEINILKLWIIMYNLLLLTVEMAQEKNVTILYRKIIK